jgi:hypothetical protein
MGQRAGHLPRVQVVDIGSRALFVVEMQGLNLVLAIYATELSRLAGYPDNLNLGDQQLIRIC